MTSRLVVAAYDTSGGRLVLPQLTEQNLPNLNHEVDELRELWRLRRAEDWHYESPEDLAARRAAQVPRSFVLRYPARCASLAAVAVEAVNIGVIVAIGAGNPTWGDDWRGFTAVALPTLMLAGPPVLGYAVTWTIIRRRVSAWRSAARQ